MKLGRKLTWTDEEAAPPDVLTSWAWQKKWALQWVLSPVVYCVLKGGQVMLREAGSLWGV